MVRERGTDAARTGFGVGFSSVLSERELLEDKLGLGGCIISLYFLSDFFARSFSKACTILLSIVYNLIFWFLS